MFDWTIIVPAFLTAAVEWVEAFTIVVAVSLSIGWRAAAGAALAAIAALAAMTFATGAVLELGLDKLQLTIGVFLLLFGVRWLAKAIARGAGLRPQHDEEEEFAQTRAELGRGDWIAAWLIAFKGVLLEGLEVWLIVVALGLQGRAWMSSAVGALAALVVVVAAGLALRAPLQRVPENAIKFAVGAMIAAFGTFWSLEAIGGDGAWPWHDWSLLALAAFYAIGGLSLIALLRKRRTAGALQ